MTLVVMVAANAIVAANMIVEDGNKTPTIATGKKEEEIPPPMATGGDNKKFDVQIRVGSPGLASEMASQMQATTRETTVLSKTGGC